MEGNRETSKLTQRVSSSAAVDIAYLPKRIFFFFVTVSTTVDTFTWWQEVCINNVANNVSSDSFLPFLWTINLTDIPNKVCVTKQKWSKPHVVTEVIVSVECVIDFHRRCRVLNNNTIPTALMITCQCHWADWVKPRERKHIKRNILMWILPFRGQISPLGWCKAFLKYHCDRETIQCEQQPWETASLLPKHNGKPQQELIRLLCLSLCSNLSFSNQTKSQSKPACLWRFSFMQVLFG